MGFNGIYLYRYPLVNKQLDPENHQFLMETSLPTPTTARVYVNLPEGNAKRFFREIMMCSRVANLNLIWMIWMGPNINGSENPFDYSNFDETKTYDE